jgi:ribosome biogenesis protein BMS1
MDADRAHKPHRPAHSGGKADKKGKGKHEKGFNEKVTLRSYDDNLPFF